MTIATRGYAAHSATSPLGLFHFVRRDLRDNDVEIDILYSGVCHSDLHTARNDWGARCTRRCRATRLWGVWWPWALR